jgi:hypothetical protein
MESVRHIMLSVLIASGTIVTACDVRVTEVKQCISTPDASSDDLVNAIKGAIERNDHQCVEEAFLSAKAKPADARLTDIGKQTLQGGIATARVPETTTVAVLSYLMWVTRGRAQDLLQEHVEAVRSVALGGSEQMRPVAISLLSTRRSNDDLDVFSAGIESGDEAALATSMFALADSCSTRASSMLKDKLHSPNVQRYLRKYADKESITRVVKERCPAALASLDRQPSIHH